MEKILVIQQKMIGDVLASTVICQVLKEHYPMARIDYMVYTHTIPVIENNPFIDQIIEFTSLHKKSKSTFRKLAKKIRNEQYEWIIDAYGKTESNLITLFSRAPKRTSYHKWYSKFYYTDTIKSKPIVYTNAGNAIEDRLRLVLEEDAIKDHQTRPQIFLTEAEKSNAKSFLASHKINFNKPLVMLSILGSSDEKSLPLPTMVAIIDYIAQTTKGDLLFNYIPSQEKVAKELYNLTQKTTQQQIHFKVYGKSLREFLAILSHCNWMIGNEGGAINMAKALSIPTFAIFSPWVAKAAWNMYEDGKDHVSIHLEDFEPEIYSTQKAKELKSKAKELYHKLDAERILPKLENYLSNFN